VLTVHEGGVSSTSVSAVPTNLGLRRAAEMVEGVAYELAGKESPLFVSRLIEIAAELDRHARAERAAEPATALS
jgi:hypothetical protein